MLNSFFDSEKVLAVFSYRGDGDLGIGVGVSGDEELEKKVGENIEKLKKKLGIENLAWMKQVHGKKVAVVKNKNDVNQEVDGIITNQKKLALMVKVADCIPILFFDEKNEVVAAVHAGRQGIFKNIVEETILKMSKNFNSQPKDIQVSLGPAIQVCCYEFENKFLDLPKMALEQLLKQGVKKENIEISKICTKCNQNYFSYRRNKKTGRFTGIIMLK